MESMERVGQVSAYIAVFWWQNTHGDSCPKFLRPWQNGVEIICCSELSEQDAEQTLPVYVVIICRWTDHASQGENCGLHFQLDAVPKGRKRSQTVMRRKKPSGFEFQMRNHGKTDKTWKAKEWSENYNLGISRHLAKVNQEDSWNHLANLHCQYLAASISVTGFESNLSALMLQQK